MRLPRMIYFDYGQTLLDEQPFDGLNGTRAVLDQCVTNPLGHTAETVQQLAEALNHDIGRFDTHSINRYRLEVHQHPFMQLLYETLSIKPLVAAVDLEQVFWDAASPGRPTPGIKSLLAELKLRSIRTGVISNISYSGAALCRRIDAHFTDHTFEPIIASSEYVFRKPHRRLFELALHKAGLEPADVWYCGDHPQYDAAGARAAGMQPVLYTGATQGDRGQPPPDSLVISHWQELITILDHLAGTRSGI